MKVLSQSAFLLVLLFSSVICDAQDIFELSLRDAEHRALRASNLLKSYVSTTDSAVQRADAQYSTLFPRLTFEANYQYLTYIPEFTVPPPFPTIPFGAHANYSFGPVLRYTLWDTFSSRKSYYGLSKRAESKDEDRKNAQLQLLLSLRSTYVRVLLGLEELRVIDSSLKLARAQNRDVTVRYRAGAAAKLDWVTSQREVLNYVLQFKKRQADLSSAFKDLLALLNDPSVRDTSHPGPPDTEDVSLVLRLEPFTKLLKEEGARVIPPPDDRQPQIRSQQLLAESSDYSAASRKATLYPLVQVLAKSALEYPNGPVIKQANQNTFGVNFSFPLFEANQTRHLISQDRKEADAARFRESQVRIDIQRDFAKARDQLASLREQRQVAGENVVQSREAARLNYDSYKAGKINFTDVQTANNQALLAQLELARIEAQILNQLVVMKALSGREVEND